MTKVLEAGRGWRGGWQILIFAAEGGQVGKQISKMLLIAGEGQLPSHSRTALAILISYNSYIKGVTTMLPPISSDLIFKDPLCLCYRSPFFGWLLSK